MDVQLFDDWIFHDDRFVRYLYVNDRSFFDEHFLYSKKDVKHDIGWDKCLYSYRYREDNQNYQVILFEENQCKVLYQLKKSRLKLWRDQHRRWKIN
jgi:hypothetical protein